MLLNQPQNQLLTIVVRVFVYLAIETILLPKISSMQDTATKQLHWPNAQYIVLKLLTRLASIDNTIKYFKWI